MTKNKTQPTTASVDAYLAGIADARRRDDCVQLASLMATVSKHEARMWGPAIVGFGTHRYALAGGKTGEICAVGFSSRKGDISIYGLAGDPADEPLLESLGKHKRGKGCLYVSRLAEVDVRVLGQLVANAVARRAE